MSLIVYHKQLTGDKSMLNVRSALIIKKAPKATCTGDSSKPYTLSGCKMYTAIIGHYQTYEHGTNNTFAKKVKDIVTGK